MRCESYEHATRLLSLFVNPPVLLPSGTPPPARQDLESVDNPAAEKQYGDEKALQYGVSSAAAGASDHFFSADTRIVFGINALEIGLVELHEMGLRRCDVSCFFLFWLCFGGAGRGKHVLCCPPTELAQIR